MNYLNILIYFLLSLTSLVQSADLVIKLEAEARSAGYTIYTGVAKWNSKPDALYAPNSAAFAQLAKQAWDIMANDINNVEKKGNRVPMVMSVFLVKDLQGNGYTAYFGSSIPTANVQPRPDPKKLLSLLEEVVFDDEGNIVNLQLARINNVLSDCLNGNDKLTAPHTGICGEPVAIQKYLSQVSDHPANDDFKKFFSGRDAQIVAWSGLSNNVWAPCGAANPTRVGCRDVVSYLGIEAVTSTSGPTTYQTPDSSSAPPFFCKQP